MTVSRLQDRKMLAVPEALLGNSQGAALLGAKQGGRVSPRREQRGNHWKVSSKGAP